MGTVGAIRQRAVCRGEPPDLGFGKIFSAKTEIRKYINAGDWVKVVTPSVGMETGCQNTVAEGPVIGKYEFHFVVDKGKYTESFTWSSVLQRNAKVWVNGKKLAFWES